MATEDKTPCQDCQHDLEATIVGVRLQIQEEAAKLRSAIVSAALLLYIGIYLHGRAKG